jgi:hypothetical protein
VQLYDKDGRDFARVSLRPWQCGGTSRLLYDGPVNGEVKKPEPEKPAEVERKPYQPKTG